MKMNMKMQTNKQTNQTDQSFIFLLSQELLLCLLLSLSFFFAIFSSNHDPGDS